MAIFAQHAYHSYSCNAKGAFCVVELDVVAPAEAEDTPPAPVLPHTTQIDAHKQTPGNKRPFEDFEPASSITVVGGSLVIKGAAVAAI